MVCGLSEAVLGGTFVKRYSMWHQRYGDHGKAPSIAVRELNIQKVPSCESLQTTCISASLSFMMSMLTFGVIFRSRGLRKIFHVRTRYMKEPYLYDNLGPEKSLPAISTPEKHRIHRNILNPLFSKQAVSKKFL